MTDRLIAGDKMNAVVNIDEPQTSGIVQMIERLAVNPDVDVSKLEKLLELQERILNRNAEIAFNDAMRAVQAEMPKIKRNKKNNQTQSMYADLEAVTNEAVPIYTKHGFSLSFSQADCPIEGRMRIVCYCSNAGHTRQYQYDASYDMTGLKGSPNKTAIQGEGSTFSYGQRYLTKLIFNITLTDEDNDGNGQPPTSPEGYEKWKADIEAVADEGTKRLQDIWEKSAMPLRVYATTNDKDWWANTKAKAAKVTK